MKNGGGGSPPQKNTTAHDAKQVWDTLSAIDVSQYVDKKGHLDYLSWGGAWILLMNCYPTAKFCFAHEDRGGVFYFKDGSAEVRCSVTINEVTRSIHLPVMDYRNNSIVDPDSRAINDAKMRSLVKALGLHGLGTYLYVGGEPPQEEEVEAKAVASKDVKKKVSKKSPAAAATKETVHEGERAAARTLMVFAEDASNTENLLALYRENKVVIDQIEKKDPELHKNVMEVFSKRKAQLLNKAPK